jgi:hypothetical protein
MLGSNYCGQSYYGQGPAVGTTFIIHTITATATALATIASLLLITKVISATVVAVGSISKLFNKTLSTSVTTVVTAAMTFFEAINIRRAATRFLGLRRASRPLEGFDNSTEELNVKKSTKIITSLQ